MYNGGDTRDRMTNRSTVRTFELFVPCWLDATESLKTKEKGASRRRRRIEGGTVGNVTGMKR